MLSLLSEIHFWSTQEDVTVKQTDYGSFKYYPKKDSSDSLCYQSKRRYCESRGLLWTPPNKRPHKLRDRLRELEDYLLHNKIVCFSWTGEQLLQLLLSTGVLVNVSINTKTGDLSNITFDKQLAAKLQVNILCDGVILGSQVICICNDGHVLGFGGPWRDGWIVEGGGPRRRLDFHNDWLAVWGKSEAEHPQPWSPLGKDYQRANLHLYWVGARGAELLAHKKTDGDPLDVIVSRCHGRTLIVIEQKVTARGAVSVEVSNYELTDGSGTLKRMSVTSVPLQTQVCCCALSRAEDRLLIGCIDGSVALLDRNRGATKTVKALFIPKFVRWQPAGALVAILNDRGQLQYFDTALTCVKSQLTAEDCTPTALTDFSGYFSVQFTVSAVSWGPKDVVVALEQGPILLLSHVDSSLTFKALAGRYLRCGKVAEATRLLLSWDFNDEAFSILGKICAYLLSRPLTEDVAKMLQDALGCFHSPPVPLASEFRSRYSHQVYSLTRRFFHQLVRSAMFETAFLLAVDLAHHDLFMDLHYVAVEIGETEMAAAARAQASALLSRCSSAAASDCSRSSCSQCTDDDDSEQSSSSDFDSSQPTVAPSTVIAAANDHNYLTTNFNRLHPRTYKHDGQMRVPPVPVIDKIAFTPRATFVEAPQVPKNFTTRCLTNNNNNIATVAPPLPSLVPQDLGIPITIATPPPPPSSSSSSRSINNFAVNKKVVKAPPLPVAAAPSLVANVSNVLSTVTNNNGGAIKKPQANKVKFSDTVTAFIVPEIKRPVRPPPPPHLTDPQKELADSLPLCHPNEDYLKDFTPIRKGEGDGGAQPKIKVVHFGVV